MNHDHIRDASVRQHLIEYLHRETVCHAGDVIKDGVYIVFFIIQRAVDLPVLAL